jgi:hypothetical protein
MPYKAEIKKTSDQVLLGNVNGLVEDATWTSTTATFITLD